MTILIAAALSAGLAFLAGCESDAQTGALLGTAAGAGVGALAGDSTEDTLIAAAMGGGVGYIIGNEQDRKKTQAEMDTLRYAHRRAEPLQQHHKAANLLARFRMVYCRSFPEFGSPACCGFCSSSSNSKSSLTR